MPGTETLLCLVGQVRTDHNIQPTHACGSLLVGEMAKEKVVLVDREREVR